MEKKYTLTLTGSGTEFIYGDNPEKSQDINELLSGHYFSIITIDLEAYNSGVISIYDEENILLEQIQVDELPILDCSQICHFAKIENSERFSLDNLWPESRPSGFEIVIDGRGILGGIVVDELPNKENILLLGNHWGEEISFNPEAANNSNLPDPIVLGVVFCDSPEQKEFYLNMVGWEFDEDAFNLEHGIDKRAFGHTNGEEIVKDIVKRSRFWDEGEFGIEHDSVKLL